MGALHQGHLSLAEAAKAACDRVIVTIFVNPKQFNNPEDLANYPRTEQDDAKKLVPYDVDAIYVPDPDEIYPEGFATTVSVSGMTDVMEGEFRPGHFDGVATVVAKLFLQTQADRAYFGEKDYQQLMIVRRMARDLDIPIVVVGCPTIREAFGSCDVVAQSTAVEQRSGHCSRKTPYYARTCSSSGKGRSVWCIGAQRRRPKLLTAGFSNVEYLQLRCAETLEPLTHAESPARLFAAAWADGVRLIDNLSVSSG